MSTPVRPAPGTPTHTPAGLLLIDAGNTRIKWRLITPGRAGDLTLAQGSCATADAASLAGAWADWPVRHAWLTCVADDQVLARLHAALATRQPAVSVTRVLPGAHCRGLANAYPAPAQLGADRWAGAIGAHHLHPGRVLVIATLGTATTLDLIVPLASPGAAPRGGGATDTPAATHAGQAAVDTAVHAADTPHPAGCTGQFAGGVILPGVELMRAALAQGTARLPLAQGHYQPVATSTGDAIVSGILHAQLGAIERLCALGQAEAAARTPGRPALCLLGGGAAAAVRELLVTPATAPRLQVEFGAADDLVLRGLALIAAGPPCCPPERS